MLKEGTILKDNDPRVTATRLVVIRQDGDRVLCQRGQRVVKIRADRIYADGKPRRTGFDVVVG
jgi:hypothetical protein